jgi:hypothetical protein
MNFSKLFNRLRAAYPKVTGVGMTGGIKKDPKGLTCTMVFVAAVGSKEYKVSVDSDSDGIYPKDYQDQLYNLMSAELDKPEKDE